MPTLADERGRDRGARQSPGDPLPRQSRWRHPLRAPLRLDRRARETMPADDRLLAAAIEGIAAPQPPPRACARRGERFLVLHRRRVWNAAKGSGWDGSASAGKLHELNRLLRGANDTTFIAGSGGLGRARRRPIRDHPRCRHASAPGRRHAPGRDHGASAQPARVRRARGPRRRRIRRPSTANHAHDAHRSRPDSSSSGSSPGRRASIPTPPRSPTSTRISSAKARTPARASTTSTRCRGVWTAAYQRTRSSATTCSKGSSRGPDSSPTSSSSRSSRRDYEVAAARQHRWARGDGLLTREVPPELTRPGTWMHDALALRDQWQSRLLRTTRWSPLA